MRTETEKGKNTEPEANAPAVLPAADDAPRALMTVAALAEIPEEDIWLAKQKSKAEGTKPSPSIRRQRSASALTLRKSAMRPISTGRCSVHFGAIARTR